jgi:hypothetical protein
LKDDQQHQHRFPKQKAYRIGPFCQPEAAGFGPEFLACEHGLLGLNNRFVGGDDQQYKSTTGALSGDGWLHQILLATKVYKP